MGRQIYNFNYLSNHSPHNQGGATGGVGGGGGGTPPTRQQIGKLLSQSAKLDWLKITTKETEIGFLNN